MNPQTQAAMMDSCLAASCALCAIVRSKTLRVCMSGIPSPIRAAKATWTQALVSADEAMTARTMTV